MTSVLEVASGMRPRGGRCWGHRSTRAAGCEQGRSSAGSHGPSRCSIRGAGLPGSRPGGGPSAPEPALVLPGRGPTLGGDQAAERGGGSPADLTAPRATGQQCGPCPGHARPAGARG